MSAAQVQDLERRVDIGPVDARVDIDWAEKIKRAKEARRMGQELRRDEPASSVPAAYRPG